MTRSELAKKIFELSHITGEFKLRSGQISNEYFDKYRFESIPSVLRDIAEQMAPLVPESTQVIAGLEMGGIPIATMISQVTGIPCAFIRKKAKDYGTCLFAEGTEVSGKNLCLIEDVITTGGQVIESTSDLRNDSAIVENVLCVIYRGKGPANNLIEKNLNLQSLYTMAELKECHD
jgi:orotate phosphoribosyltransferase